MELELQKERFECYRPGAALLLDREETAETIVPDYSPDIARIVNVSACLLVRSRTVSDGKLTAAASVRLTLLYVAEDAPGLRSMEYAIPCELSEKLPDGCAEAAVEGRVCGVEARLLNPRKLFTRMELTWRITPYCRTVLTTCGTIPEQAAYAIETLCERREASLIRAVSEKDFVFSDEISLPGGREPIRELLQPRVKLRVTEVKSIGSKAILKGVACVSLLYASGDDKLCSYAEELPFSQILDGVSEELGETTASAVLSLSDLEIHTGGDPDGDTVSLKLFLNALVVLRGRETVCCITDLYSSSYDLDAQMERIELWQEPEVSSVTQSVREQLDTGTEVKCVLSADVCFGSVGVQRENGRTLLRASAAASVLYQDEADVPICVERRIEITAEAAAAPADAQLSVENVCAGDLAASINANGIELRFPAEFTLVSTAPVSCECLTSLSVAEPSGEGEAAQMPSIILRALDEGERLWDIAKQYRTTVESILSANELADEAAAAAGRMLLIPRKR